MKKWLDWAGIPSNAAIHNIRRKLLVDFIISIPDWGGWWYRMPSYDSTSDKPQHYCIEKNLPHLGHVFGMEENAMAINLLEMVLLKLKGRRTIVIRHEFDWLKALFKLHSRILEVEDTSFKALNRNKCRKLFVKIGSHKMNPLEIICLNLLPPSKLTVRETSAFVCTKIMEIYQ
mmetsp:Transcript_697/g.1115  ORF Transcript_697/g.1115 Transcript_697/m.1115 type:complete len:174 (+) Transcript_697:59-580(+)